MDLSLAEFTLLDWFLLAVVIYSVVMSALRGFVREVFGLATVILGLLLAAWFYRGLGTLFVDVVASENIALFLGFALIFVVTLAGGFATIWVVRRLFEFTHLEWFDRVLGGAFGFVRGWLIGVVVFIGLTSFGIQEDAVRNSELSPYFLSSSRAVAALAPFELKAKFLIGYEAVERWWRENL